MRQSICRVVYRFTNFRIRQRRVVGSYQYLRGKFLPRGNKAIAGITSALSGQVRVIVAGLANPLIFRSNAVFMLAVLEMAIGKPLFHTAISGNSVISSTAVVATCLLIVAIPAGLITVQIVANGVSIGVLSVRVKVTNAVCNFVSARNHRVAVLPVRVYRTEESRIRNPRAYLPGDHNLERSQWLAKVIHRGEMPARSISALNRNYARIRIAVPDAAIGRHVILIRQLPVAVVGHYPRVRHCPHNFSPIRSIGWVYYVFESEGVFYYLGNTFTIRTHIGDN